MKLPENILNFKPHGNLFPAKLIILFSLLFYGFIYSAYTQTPLLDKELQFKEKTTTVKQFLFELGKAGGFYFSYSQKVPLKKKVQISSEKQSVRKHLDHIFNGESFKYIEQGKKILIVPNPEKKEKLKQTIRGRVVDLDSKVPLIHVNIILDSITSYIGTTTDENGYFRFNNVPVGRHNLIFSYVGYESKLVSNFLVASGKEYIVPVEMEESAVKIPEVKVTFTENKSRPINDLTIVSGRSFSANEIENYPGSLSDISRTSMSFPGVTSANDGQNHIIIRGNSPKGLQWRLEGVEIPNLNHFAEIGASGGGVNVISNNMIAGSDFITSAFPAEYGNAISGVFDLRLRNGNNEKHEQTVQVGVIGTELMVEGPIKKETNTTYIAQYRYSTLRLFQELGVPLESVPDFQDLSFKIYHPTKKAGVFSLFGIGGLSREEGDAGYVWKSNMATVGLSNSLTINPKTFLKSILSFSGWKYSWDQGKNIGSAESPINQVWKTNVKDYMLKASFSINKKITAKHKIKAGVV
ncbi:MAG: TonB-dependent receptor, partial [Bacteroidota bacterium]